VKKRKLEVVLATDWEQGFLKKLNLASQLEETIKVETELIKRAPPQS
jgi:hypothetical protein